MFAYWYLATYCTIRLEIFTVYPATQNLVLPLIWFHSVHSWPCTNLGKLNRTTMVLRSPCLRSTNVYKKIGIMWKMSKFCSYSNKFFWNFSDPFQIFQLLSEKTSIPYDFLIFFFFGISWLIGDSPTPFLEIWLLNNFLINNYFFLFFFFFLEKCSGFWEKKLWKTRTIF